MSAREREREKLRDEKKTYFQEMSQFVGKFEWKAPNDLLMKLE